MKEVFRGRWSSERPMTYSPLTKGAAQSAWGLSVRLSCIETVPKASRAFEIFSSFRFAFFVPSMRDIVK
jgi:hypothetical protein